jgi:ribA/ribD-fused uncharacterized protein
MQIETHHGLDTDAQVFFYEQDFYVLSNFSSFEVDWSGFPFKTAEHLYHWLRFSLSDEPDAYQVAGVIKNARSAHDAFKLAQANKRFQRHDWDDVKVGSCATSSAPRPQQHEYVRRKLLATGDRELVEDSWRDDFWGWGPNRDGRTCSASCGWKSAPTRSIKLSLKLSRVTLCRLPGVVGSWYAGQSGQDLNPRGAT